MFYLIELELVKSPILARYEACSLRVVREMQVPLSALYRSPALYILRRERSALVTINIVWSSEQKDHLSEAFYCGFTMCRDICDLDLYFGYL